VGFVALLAAVAVAAVFTVSGVAKLLDRAGTREAVEGFGVPDGLVSPVAVGLAPAELVTALLLFLPPTRLTGLVLAAVLLVAFTVVVLLALRAGRRPECHCFGRIGGADVSARTVVRNLVLFAIAGVGLAGVTSAGDVDGGRLVAAVVAGLALAAAVLAAEGVAGARARARRAAEDETAFAQDVAATAVAPFSLPDLAGTPRTLADLLGPGLPVLLVTLSPGCGPCKRLRPDVARWAELFAGTVSVVALATGTREANLPSYADLPALPVLVDEDGTVRELLGTGATPSAVLIGPDARLASRVAGGEALVRRLLVATVTGTTPDPTLDDRPDAEADGLPAAELDLDAVVAPRPGVQQHQLGESTVLLDPATGATVVLDQIGSVVWSVLDGASPLRAIVADVADVYEVPAQVVGPDLLRFVRSVGAAGLLAGVLAGPAPADDHQAVGAG
jgi:thiol-disulfide isomerase/thioredoxin